MRVLAGPASARALNLPAKLLLVKLVHTIIFVFMLSCLVYILYAAMTRTYHWALLVAIGAILIDGLALLLNRMTCPLTTLAQRLGDERGSVSNFFFPQSIARHVFRVSLVLFPAEVILLALGYLTQ